MEETVSVLDPDTPYELQPDTTTEENFVPLEEYYSEPATVPIENSASSIQIIDYTPLIQDTGNMLAEVILFAALCVSGTLCALKILGVKAA